MHQAADLPHWIRFCPTYIVVVKVFVLRYDLEKESNCSFESYSRESEKSETLLDSIANTVLTVKQMSFSKLIKLYCD